MATPFVSSFNLKTNTLYITLIFFRVNDKKITSKNKIRPCWHKRE
jgi:hypothetical protein